MKKLLSIILVLALLIPVASLAAGLDVGGCWATYDMQTTGAPQFVVIYLAEDYTCYYLAQSFKKDDVGLGRAYVGTWELQDDGTVLAKTGENTETILTFDATYVIAMNMKTGKLFINLSMLYADWE